MAIESILVAITELSRVEIAEILKSGEEKAKEVRAAASARAEREIERYVREACDQAERKATREVRAAHLRNGKICSDIRLSNYDKLKEMTAARLAEIRDCPEYPSIFDRLVRNVIFGVGDKPIVFIDARDHAVAQDCFKAADLAELGIEIRDELTTLGGLKVCSNDGRILRDNTFESRLSRLYDERAGEIWAVLES